MVYAGSASRAGAVASPCSPSLGARGQSVLPTCLSPGKSPKNELRQAFSYSPLPLSALCPRPHRLGSPNKPAIACGGLPPSFGAGGTGSHSCEERSNVSPQTDGEASATAHGSRPDAAPQPCSPGSVHGSASASLPSRSALTSGRAAGQASPSILAGVRAAPHTPSARRRLNLAAAVPAASVAAAPLSVAATEAQPLVTGAWGTLPSAHALDSPHVWGTGGGTPDGGLQSLAQMLLAALADLPSSSPDAPPPSSPLSSPTPASLSSASPSSPSSSLLLRRRCLVTLHTSLTGGAASPREVLALPGVLALLVAHVGAPGDSTTMALESLCTLLTEDASALVDQLLPAIPRTLAVLRSASITTVPPPPPPPVTRTLSPPRHGSPSRSSSPRSPAPASADSDPWTHLVLASRSPPTSAPAPQPTTPQPAPDSSTTSHLWGNDVSCAFFACSMLVRAVRYPALAAAAVQGGGLELLVRLLDAKPDMVAQIAVFALYKLVRAAPAAAPPCSTPPSAATSGLQHPPHASPRSSQQNSRPHQQQQSASQPDGGLAGAGSGNVGGGGSQSAALLAVAQAGGLAALCRCLGALDDRPSQDMASSLLLDMALVPQVPSTVARLNQVASLVGVLASRRGAADMVRIYALLVLARLCNYSPECQMDAVREGAVPPLLELVRGGVEEEQTHACRLLAILAQAVPTHGRFKELQVVSALLPLLRGGRSQMVSEHAASVVAVLAQNPDLHFHIVGCGAVPAMMPLLFSGTDKTRTYVMASLMLLVDHEERHASVVARAGAIPALINLARGQAAGAAASAPGSGNGSGVGALVASAAVGGGKRSAEGTTTAAAGGASAAQQQAQQRGTAVQEFAVAVLCSLSRYVDIQTELAAARAVPTLLHSVEGGSPGCSPDSATYALEALAHMAAGNAALKRIVSGSVAATAAMVGHLGPAAKPNTRYWALQLLRVLSTDDQVLQQVVDVAAAAAAVVSVHRYPEAGAGSGADASGAEGTGAGAGKRSVGAVDLVGALCGLLNRADETPSWQAGRCRVLAAWLLARLCGAGLVGMRTLGESGAVRQLTAMLAAAQQQQATQHTHLGGGNGGSVPQLRYPDVTGGGGGQGYESDSLRRGGAGGGMPLGLPGDAALPPLFPLASSSSVPSGGLGGGSGFSFGSGSGLGGEAEVTPLLPSAARGHWSRFDSNGVAAASAALRAIAQVGPEARSEVLKELALQQWCGVSIRVELP